MITSDLKWTKHIQHVLATITRKFHFIRRNCFSITNPFIRRLIISTYILPSYTYLASIYTPNKLCLQKLDCSFKRCLRWICQDYNATYKNLLINLNFLPIGYLLDFATLKALHKIRSNNLQAHIPEAAMNYTRPNLRRSTQLINFQIKQEFNRSNFWYRAIELSNILPPTFFQCDHQNFKSHVKRWLTDRMILNFSENDTCTFSTLCKCTSCRELKF